MKANPSSLYLTDLRNYTKYYGSEDRPMAGLFKSSGSIGIMAIATDFHHHNPSNEPYSIGLVGRSNAPGTAVKNIGVYGEGEGVGERVGVMGYADSTNTSLAIGIRGIAKGTLGIAGEFKAAEGLHVEGDRIGLHVIAPTNEISGASTSPLLTLQRLSLIHIWQLYVMPAEYYKPIPSLHYDFLLLLNHLPLPITAKNIPFVPMPMVG